MSLALRHEQPADLGAIREVTRAAFLNAAHASHTEHLIVDALRQAGALSLSLVAETGDNIIGHVAVSPVTISDGAPGWFGLGPVSVLPAYQGHGVGSLLVQETLRVLRQRAAAGCVVLGEPSFYSRFGFKCEADLVLPCVPPEYFQAICLHGAVPRGDVRYHDAFNVSGE
jgi:putative acetyltransferase